VGIPLTVGFRLSRSLWLSQSPFHKLFLFHDGILAITKPFTRTFLFSWWNFGYHEAFHMNFSFFTVEFRLSLSLSHEFFFFHGGILSITKPFTDFSFTWWNLDYHEAFLRIFSFTSWNLGYHRAFSRIFLSHDGISAITEPFHEFFFHMVESLLSRSLFTNFSFTWWNLVYHGAFSRTFLSHDGIHKMHDLGEDSFHIYHKEYLHRTRLIKNLASWFRAPSARKRVRSSLF
jgi:hypothetical protein